MKAYLKRNFTKGFFLSEEGVVKLADICRKRMADRDLADALTYKVFRSDALVYETGDHREITREENSQRNSLTRIHFLCVHDDLQFELDFDKKDGVLLSIECNDKDFGYLLFSDIKDYLQTEVLKFRRKTFGAMFEHRIFFSLILVGMMIMIIFIMPKPDIDADSLANLLASESVVDKMNYLIKHANNRDSLKSLRFIWLFPIGLVFPLVFLGPLLDKIYPRNVFYWGKVSTQYDRIVSVRSKVLWGIVVAFIISAIASFVVYYLTMK